MLLQLGELDEPVLRGGFGQAVPGGIPIESDGVRLGAGFMSANCRGSSAQTQLSWRVTAAAQELGRGTITWPRDLNDDAEAYAAELLEVAEASFVPGCPPGAPPATHTAQLGALSANHLDTDEKSLNQAASSLDKAWRDLVSERCPPR
jgi:hypothetical protein